MKKILIKDAMILEEAGLVKYHQDIEITDSKITAVTDTLPNVNFVGEVVDGHNKLFMPGMTDSHLHTGQQLLRGRVLDTKPIIWTRIMLPFESRMNSKIMKLNAQLASLELISSGTTSFIEAGSYFMDEAAKVYQDVGLRGALSFSTMDDQNLPQSIRMSAEEAVSYTDNLYNSFDGQGNLSVYYSLRTMNNASDKLIRLAGEHAKERGTFLQAHMNEYPKEVADFKERSGLTPYEHLDKMGFLDDKFIGAHSIFLSDKEKELIKTKKSKISHSPFSNCGKGVPDTPHLIDEAVVIGLGTDGAAHGGLSMWNEAKIFRSIMNVYYGVQQKKPNIMPANRIFSMILDGGAELINQKGQLGKIKPGYTADLISINLNAPHLIPTGIVTNMLLESVNANDVYDSMVAGKWLMRNREFLTIDAEKVEYEANKMVEKIFN